MRVDFAPDALEDYQHWVRTDHVMLNRLNALIEDARRNGFTGIGKPEPLKGDLSGWWSRRMSGAHRLVYRIIGKSDIDQSIEIISCRYHYTRP